MSGRRPFFLAVLVVAVAAAAGAAPVWGQEATIRGTVVGAETGEPLPGAHVFVSESMIGTTTDSTGHFRLRGVPRGSKRVVASMMGYAPQHTDLFVRADTTVSLSFSLPPTVVEGEEVVIEGERDEDWYEDLKTFKRLFLGSTPLADSCDLLNPKVLRFDSGWWKGLEARSVAPLRIENRALGYRIRYALKEFDKSGSVVKWDGDPHFEEMTPSDSAEAARWRANRRKAYYGSLRHFLRALIDDRLDEEGFDIERIPRASAFRDVARADRFPASRKHVLDGRTDSTYRMDFRGRLQVLYRNEPETRGYLRWQHRHSRVPRSVQTSWIELNDPPAHVDRYGEIVEPYGATVYGYFAYEQRISGLLPREYRPR
jgi:hypothetical protein